MLHTVNKSITDKPSLLSCLRLAKVGSDILLIEDAVYSSVKGTAHTSALENALAKHRIFALQPDLECRGVKKEELIAGINTVDYEGFVKLAVENEAVNAWL